MKIVLNLLNRFLREERGQDLLEYALLIVLVVIVAAAAINPLGRSVAAVYRTANTCISGGACVAP